MSSPERTSRARARRYWAAALPLAFCLASAAEAGAPVAIVEAVDAPGAGVEFMDYLEVGQTLQLGAEGSVEIGYLASCVDERVVGGVVTIGGDRSEVVGGDVERRTVACDPGQLGDPPAGSDGYAGSVQRSLDENSFAIAALRRPQLLLHGASPLIVAHGASNVSIESLVDRASPETLALAPRRRFSMYDFASQGRSLKKGVLYLARLGDQQIVFRIARDAKPGSTSIIGRLILFPAKP